MSCDSHLTLLSVGVDCHRLTPALEGSPVKKGLWLPWEQGLLIAWRRGQASNLLTPALSRAAAHRVAFLSECPWEITSDLRLPCRRPCRRGHDDDARSLHFSSQVGGWLLSLGNEGWIRANISPILMGALLLSYLVGCRGRTRTCLHWLNCQLLVYFTFAAVGAEGIEPPTSWVRASCSSI